MDGEPRPYNAVARHETAKDLAMHILRLLLISILTFSASSAALAQKQGANQAVQAACRGDAQRLCQGVQPGGGRMGQCLKARINEVSPGCLEAVRASRQGGNSPR